MIVFGGGGGSTDYSSTTPHKRVWVLDFTPPSCTPPPTGMISWWTGDGNANDLIGSNHGTLQNGATFAPGLVNQAFSTNEIGAYGEIPNSPSLQISGALSVDCWVYPLPHDGSGIVTNADNSLDGAGWAIGYYGTPAADPQHIAFVINESFTTYSSLHSPANSVPFYTWTHIAATSNGTTMRLYINGIEVNSAPSPPVLTSTFTTLLGAYQRNGVKEQFFKGLIDEVEVFNRALTASEIQVLFNAGPAGKCKNQAPVAICQNITVAADANCTATASINNGSYDPDGDALTITQSPAGPYPPGNTLVTLTVTDSKGASSQCTATVTVVDNTSPALVLEPAISLWSPNHKYTTVTTGQMVQGVSDSCATLSLSHVVIEQVTSDEPDNGLGDGDTANDMVIAPDCKAVQLRAERAGDGNGRIYSVRLRLQDAAGNITRQEFKVKVPPNQNGSSAIEDAPVSTVTSACGSSNSAQPAGSLRNRW